MILSGWLFYAAIYLAFGWLDTVPLLIAIFLTYGIYFGLAEPAERAWIAGIVPRELRGTAFGWYHCTVGIAALPGSLLFGWLWQQWSVTVAFTTGAALAAGASVLLCAVPSQMGSNHSSG